jgi:hypothetical protein
MFAALEKDMLNAMKIKHKTLKDSNIPDSLLQKIIKDDKLFMSQWKQSLLTTVAITIPKKYLKSVPRYVVDGTEFDETIKNLKEDSE